MNSYISSAIIDRHTSEALLAYASKEKLIWSTRETDGVFERIVSADYHPLISHQLRERLVVSPKLVFHDFPDFLWEALDGPLKDNGHIANIQPPTSTKVRPKNIPLDVISGILGRVVTERELNAVQRDVAKALAEQQHFEETSGRKAPDVFKEGLVAIFRNIGEAYSDYSSEEIQAQRERNDIYSAAAPYITAAEEYSKLANAASIYGIMLGTPLLANDTAANILNPYFSPDENDSEVSLFRIVCNELGKTTLRSTITETLKLSKEPATKSLREMLPLWHSQIASGNEREIAKLKNEIAQANQALSNLSGVQTAGRITTWLAIPIAFVELILKLHPIAGVTASAIGVFAVGKEQRVREHYLWATYGGT